MVLKHRAGLAIRTNKTLKTREFSGKLWLSSQVNAAAHLRWAGGDESVAMPMGSDFTFKA